MWSVFLLFFFSSRRRHTRFDCDWSSDVCSSDLDTTDESGVVAALAQHESPNVPAVLERLAAKDSPYEIRKNAIFWLGVRGGEPGFRFLRTVVRSDESREIRKKAVFAISQSKVPQAL